MKLIWNPYTGGLLDLDTIPGVNTADGEAKFCPTTKRPLNEAALKLTPYPGPPEDAAAWRADQLVLMQAIAAQSEQEPAVTLGVTPPPPGAAAPAPTVVAALAPAAAPPAPPTTTVSTDVQELWRHITSLERQLAAAKAANGGA